MINYLWCVHNPLHYRGYGPHNWGLTASYSPNGYAAHAPGAQTDLGVISPTAAVSSIVYTPHQSMQAIRYWFTTPQLKDKIWGLMVFMMHSVKRQTGFHHAIWPLIRDHRW